MAIVFALGFVRIRASRAVNNFRMDHQGTALVAVTAAAGWFSLYGFDQTFYHVVQDSKLFLAGHVSPLSKKEKPMITHLEHLFLLVFP